MASFTERLQPDAAAAGAIGEVPALEDPQDTAPAPPNQATDAPMSTCAPSTCTTSAIPDRLIGLLETFLKERQSQNPSAPAFGSYVIEKLAKSSTTI